MSARSRQPAQLRRQTLLHAVRSGPPLPGETLPSFPVVGVGASAGGLDAFRQLLAHVPADSGLALVLVQHLEATRASLLSDALAQATAMKVAQAQQGVRIEPNCVYVIPPGVQMAIEQGTLKLSRLEETEHRPHLPIDFFLRSLAAERGRRAIGVILSGTASDGTAGLAAIRAQGGITFAQDPRSARSGGMPQSAVDAGVVDFCLPLPELGAELTRLARHPYVAHNEPVPPIADAAGSLARVLAVLRAATGVDFGEYKPATLKRRLARRMAVRKVKNVAAYLELLRREPAEIQSLYDDLLIKVTSFFRDEGGLDELAKVALPEILRHKAPGAPIRVWVVGCATGEEVYSLAISLVEHLDGCVPAHPVLIFGSDLSEKAIESARAGLYPDVAVRALGEERLKRFFVRAERGWRVRPALRELCVFVRHDVARDPPFSKLDLLSCRNVLIYFGQALQRRVMAMAHYSLNQPGYLLLGRSESASSVPRWFAPASKDGRLYQRRPGPSTFHLTSRVGGLPFSRPPHTSSDVPPPTRTEGVLARHADDLVLARYGPPGVVVNDRLEVLQFRGRTGPYLEPPAGEPQSQLLRLARPGLAGPLRLALAKARRTSAPVKREGVVVDEVGGRRTCDLAVLPLKTAETGEQTFLVLFEERPAAAPRSGRARGSRRGRLDPVARGVLEDELASTKEELAEVLEERGRGSEVLASTNDELVSGNEELQSLNEELETAKEELQATNEELSTVNDELRSRNHDLQVVNADVLNLLDAVEIPILMLDQEGRVRRFTRRAASLMELTSADVGRRIVDLALPVRAPDLELWLAKSMEQAILVEAEVQDRSERWHRLQIRPRRAPDGRIDGTTLSLVDIQDLKHDVATAEWARDYAAGIVEAVQVPLVVLGAGLRVLSANAAYYRLCGEAAAQSEARGFFELGGGEWDMPELRRALDGVLEQGGRFQALEVARQLPGAGLRNLSVSGCAFPSPARTRMILLALEDVTELREAERRRSELLALTQEAARRAERADAAKDLFLGNLSHELRTPLMAILLLAQALQREGLDAAVVKSAASTIESNTVRQARLVEDLLDMSRIVSGKLSLNVEEVNWQALVLGVLEGVKPEAEAKAVELAVELQGEPSVCLGDPVRLQQVVANLLNNAVKFTPGGGRVGVRIDAIDGAARLVVTDDGQGIDSAFLPHVFERFAQEPGSPARVPGLGIGLTLVRELVELHGGTVRAESPGRNLGSTFTVTLPRRLRGADPTTG